MRGNRLSLSETEAGKLQERGDVNMDFTADCIRIAIRDYGKQVSADDRRNCYPTKDLPSFVRMEARMQGNPMGRSLITVNITDLTFKGHPGHEFETITLPDGQEVIVNKPSPERQNNPPASSRARETRPRTS